MNIKELREKTGLTQEQFAEKLGIPRDRLAKWEQGKGSPRLADEKKIVYIFGDIWEKVPSNQEMKEEGVDYGSYHEKRREMKQSALKRGRIQFWDAPAEGGTIQPSEMNPVYAPAGTIDVGDLLHDSEAAIRIYGNSMLPGYPPGCVVGLVKVTSSYIQPGEVYVIETRDQRVLKRLFYQDDDPKSNILTCVSDNTMKFENGGRHGKLAYPNFDIPKEEITNLFMVTGVIKRNSNSVIINR